MNLRFCALSLTAALGFVRAGRSAIAVRLLQVRRPFVVFAAALSLSIVGASASQSPPSTAPPMPDYLEVPGTYERPIFVAADVVMLPNGQVNRAFFPGEYGTSGLERILSREKTNDCVLLDDPTDPMSQVPARHESLEGSINDNDNIVEATVTGTRTGFALGRAGTLVRLQVELVLKGARPSQTKYVFFPYGDLEVGATRICVRDPHWGEVPRVGDRVVVLFAGHKHNELMPILAIDPSSILTIRNGRVARLPEVYRKVNQNLRDLELQQLTAGIRLHVLLADGEE